ncbi:MAG: tetratricopeptide repeat protein, partial [bacterium]|nr:tetratricopeptide repeat protein [bacterium]
MKTRVSFPKLLIIFFLTGFILVSPSPLHAKKAKAEKPSDRAILHNNLGVTALYEGSTDRALFEFKTATELSPKYVEAWNNLGLAYKFKGNMESAINALKTA